MGTETKIRIESELTAGPAYDVIVAGGGTAGVVAAIAAARMSVKVLLVENNGFLGGTLLKGAGPLHSFFNVYKPWENVPKVQVVKGIPSEIVDRLIETGGSKGHLEQEKGYYYDSIATLIDRNEFKYLAQEMVLEAGVDILFEARVSDYYDDGSLRGLIVETRGGREFFPAKMIIDCSGDAVVAHRAGLSLENRGRRNTIGFPFGMANVDMKKVETFLENEDMITQIVHCSKEPGEDDVLRLGFDLKKNKFFTSFMDEHKMWGPLGYSFHKNDFCFINTAHMTGVDTLDAVEYSRALVTLRRQAMGMAEKLKAHIPGFENAYVSWMPDTVGTRMSRIVDCDYVLTKEDIVDARRFDDEICVYGFHDMAPEVMIKDGKAYGIPYRCLLPKGSDHILVAGRMITKEHAAHMSTRNTVSCMAQGQGAGVAAALCAREGIRSRELNYTLLRKELLKQDVFLGTVC